MIGRRHDARTLILLGTMTTIQQMAPGMAVRVKMGPDMANAAVLRSDRRCGGR